MKETITGVVSFLQTLTTVAAGYPNGAKAVFVGEGDENTASPFVVVEPTIDPVSSRDSESYEFDDQFDLQVFSRTGIDALGRLEVLRDAIMAGPVSVTDGSISGREFGTMTVLQEGPLLYRAFCTITLRVERTRTDFRIH